MVTSLVPRLSLWCTDYHVIKENQGMCVLSWFMQKKVQNNAAQLIAM